MLPVMEVVLFMPLPGVPAYGSMEEGCSKRGDRRSICEWDLAWTAQMLEEVLGLSSLDF